MRMSVVDSPLLRNRISSMRYPFLAQYSSPRPVIAIDEPTLEEEAHVVALAITGQTGTKVTRVQKETTDDN